MKILRTYKNLNKIKSYIARTISLYPGLDKNIFIGREPKTFHKAYKVLSVLQ